MGPEPMTRLGVVIGYPREQIIETLTTLYSMPDEEANDLYARVTEDTLSAEDTAATL